ncbi:MAG TPA: hypothetical protein VMM55_07920 [Thermohalobaculum sp.]|nr:hypothetical protein [Thermohalobaculum sp.]
MIAPGGDGRGRRPDGAGPAASFEIVEVQTAAGGVIGLARLPGLRDGRFRWDLLEDELDRVAEWGATAILCLIENDEIPDLDPERMLFETRRRDIGFLHLPIPEGTVPGAAFDTAWEGLRGRLIRAVGKCQRPLVLCSDGRGRCSMIAARLLIDSGMQVEAAIRALRDASPGALRDREHEENVRAYARGR